MGWRPTFDGLECLECGHSTDPSETQCPHCDGRVTISWTSQPPIDSTDRSDLWQFADVLPPVPPAVHHRSAGGTDLVKAPWLADTIGTDDIYIKDEGANPTGHVSDRDMAVLERALTLLDVGPLAIASTGRSGVAAAAIGNSARVYVPSRAPFPVKAMVNVYGGQMRVVRGRFPDVQKSLSDDWNESWYDAGPHNPFRLAGRATWYLETIAQLGWEAPNVLVVPVAHGGEVAALAPVMRWATEQGVVDHEPRIVLAQAAGCAPLVDAVHDEADRATTWDSPDTIVGELEVSDPTLDRPALDLVEATEVTGVAVPDPAALEAAVSLAQADGISVSVAGGVAAAAATDCPDVAPGDTVVVHNPGTGHLDADVLRSHLMSKGI